MTTGKAGGPLGLLGSVARLLNAGLGPEATLAAVAESLRTGLPAQRVSIWFREPGATWFRAVAAPLAADAPRTVDTLDRLPPAAGGVRRSMEHEGIQLGVIEAALEPKASQVELLTITADTLAPFLASLELSQDLAGEVAAQSREIEEHRRFTSLVIDTLPVGLYVVDRDYRIQIWNRKRETGTQGLRRGEVVGRPIFEVLTRQSPEQLRAEFDRVFETGEIQQSEIEVVLGGESRHFRISKIPMRLEGDAISHVITVGEDVTEWHAIQAQITQSEKLAAVGQLAAGVMHEINNPLATIGACVAAMEGHLAGLPESTRGALEEYLQIIEKEMDRCSRIVDGLLDFSRPKSKSRRPVILDAVVEQTLSLLKHHQRFKRLDVVQELDPASLATVGDQEQLIQLLLALTLNAVDAMEHGGRLTLRTARSRQRADELVLEVQDTGVGIPAPEQGKIFEPFYTTKPPGRGTGLGLSICYGIVEQHRGRIEVESAPGKGATFRVHLPRWEGPDSGK